MSDAVSASYAAEAVRRVKKLEATLAQQTALLIEVAGWIARLEEGVARDGGHTSPTAEKLRRLIADFSETPKP